jgi:hypothetical protein
MDFAAVGHVVWTVFTLLIGGFLIIWGIGWTVSMLRAADYRRIVAAGLSLIGVVVALLGIAIVASAAGIDVGARLGIAVSDADVGRVVDAVAGAGVIAFAVALLARPDTFTPSDAGSTRSNGRQGLDTVTHAAEGATVDGEPVEPDAGAEVVEAFVFEGPSKGLTQLVFRAIPPRRAVRISGLISLAIGALLITDVAHPGVLTTAADIWGSVEVVIAVVFYSVVTIGAAVGVVTELAHHRLGGLRSALGYLLAWAAVVVIGWLGGFLPRLPFG